MTEGFEPQTIPDRPVPLLNGGMTDTTGTNSDSGIGDIPTPQTLSDISIPQGFNATEVIAESLDTQARAIKGNYTFEQMGALEIGQILISPSGIVAEDLSGNPTVTIDADTGNATFKGTVAAGSIVTGYIQVGGAAGDVNGGSTTISGGMITTGSVTATQINASYMSAIQINASQIIAGQMIVGGSSQPTALIIQHSTNDSNSRLRFQGGSRIWEDNNNRIGINSVGDQMYIYCGSNLKIAMDSDTGHEITMQGGVSSNGNLDVHGGTHLQGDLTIDADYMAFGGGSGPRFSVKNMGLTSYREGGGNAALQWGSGQTFRIAPGSGNTFSINGNGAKTAIVSTSKGYRALYCVESPEVWFMDFCTYNKKFSFHKTWKFWKWGIDTVAHPDLMFLEVTEKPYIIMPTMIRGLVQVWGHRKKHNERFEEKTEEEFKKNNEFWQQAKVV